MTRAMDSEFRYIAVEGPIGVGKTTLARRLAATFGAGLLLEAPDENPFLPGFYRAPEAHALATQMFFLLQRVKQMEGVRQGDMFNTLRVADFLVEKDRLFAGLTLSAGEYELYDELYRRLLGDAPRPDLVIYLQAPVPVLRERIARRGIDYEQPMEDLYLERVAGAYQRFFRRYDDAPLVVINAAEMDLAHADDDYDLLLDQLATLRKGRHYMNPLPF